MSDSADDLARHVGKALYDRDNATRHLGIKVSFIAAGKAELCMTVADFMSNGLGLCHGGYIFTLADSAFAYACQSRNQAEVAHNARIDFLAPAYCGDMLVAVAEEQQRSRRGGLYDVTVYTEKDGEERHKIAIFRGLSAAIKGEIISRGQASDS